MVFMPSDCKCDQSFALQYVKRGSTRQYHTFHGELRQGESYTCCNLLPVQSLFPFDIGFIANQTVNNSGRGYLI